MADGDGVRDDGGAETALPEPGARDHRLGSGGSGGTKLKPISGGMVGAASEGARGRDGGVMTWGIGEGVGRKKNKLIRFGPVDLCRSFSMQLKKIRVREDL